MSKVKSHEVTSIPEGELERSRGFLPFKIKGTMKPVHLKVTVSFVGNGDRKVVNLVDKAGRKYCLEVSAKKCVLHEAWVKVPSPGTPGEVESNLASFGISTIHTEGIFNSHFGKGGGRTPGENSGAAIESTFTSVVGRKGAGICQVEDFSHK